MKWTHIDKKEPAFDKKLLFSRGDGEWESGTLREIRTDIRGKSMEVYCESEENTNGFIYWTDPEAPNTTSPTKPKP